MFISNETKNNLQAQKWMPVDCVFAKHNMSFSNKILAIHIVAKFRPILAVNTSISRYCVADPGISSRRGWCFITCSAKNNLRLNMFKELDWTQILLVVYILSFISSTVLNTPLLSPLSPQGLPSQNGPTSPSRARAPDRSSYGTSSWSCWGKKSTTTSLPGRETMGSLSSKTQMRLPAYGGPESVNHRWTMTSSAER